MSPAKRADEQETVVAADPPPLPSDDALEGAGLTVARSEAVRAITDAPDAEAAAVLPTLDAAAAAMPRLLGKVPARFRSPASPAWTAALVRAEERFRGAGVLSRPLRTDVHGLHEGWRFWMRWPERPYYRRHLAVHEMTHCWTMAAGGKAPAPLLEGVAEWFATHAGEGAAARFAAVPTSAEEFRGWGRVEMLRDAVAEVPLTAAEVMRLRSGQFTGRPTAYAWAWAWCALAANDPATAERFAVMVRRLTAGEPVWEEAYAIADELDASGRWSWWASACDYGVDPAVTAPRAAERDGDAWTVAARAGWQETGVVVPEGGSVRVEADGLAVLGEGGRPWTSGPGGIRLDYFGGVPVGALMACVRRGAEWGEPVAVGEGGEVAGGGVLCLRVNDGWAEAGDNAGGYRVVVIGEP